MTGVSLPQKASRYTARRSRRRHRSVMCQNRPISITGNIRTSPIGLPTPHAWRLLYVERNILEPIPKLACTTQHQRKVVTRIYISASRRIARTPSFLPGNGGPLVFCRRENREYQPQEAPWGGGRHHEQPSRGGISIHRAYLPARNPSKAGSSAAARSRLCRRPPYTPRRCPSRPPPSLAWRFKESLRDGLRTCGF